MTRLFIFLIAVSLFVACNSKKESSGLAQVSMNPQEIILFYLDSLQHQSLTKIVSINQKSDTIKILHADWIQEMDFLDALNTNKPAYKGALMLDTMHKADTLIYHLTCIDQKLPMKEATIYYHKEQLLHMNIKSFQHNFLFNNVKEIYFNPLKGYCIKGFQKLDLITKHNVSYTIQVTKT